MSSGSPVSRSPESTPCLSPVDPPKENSLVNKTIEVVEKTRGFEVSPEANKLFSATQVAPFSPPTPSPSPSPTFSLLDAVRKYDAENPNKEADARSPSPPVKEEQEPKPKEDRYPALYDAVCKGEICKLQAILSKGEVNLFQADRFGRNLLHMAVLNGFREIANALLTFEHKLLNIPTLNRRSTPLHIAAKQGSVPLTSLLLTKKPELDHVDLDGNTPLHLASQSKNITVFDKLVSAGSDTTIGNKEGEIAKRPQDNACSASPNAIRAELEELVFPDDI